MSSISITGGILFPSSTNISLSKEEKAAITLMHDAFKIFKVVAQMSISTMEVFPKAMDTFKDISATALAGMWTQLHAHDQAWMCKALPVEALPTWHSLKSSTLDTAECDWFFTAMKYAMYKSQAAKPKWHDKKLS